MTAIDIGLGGSVGVRVSEGVRVSVEGWVCVGVPVSVGVASGDGDRVGGGSVGELTMAVKSWGVGGADWQPCRIAAKIMNTNTDKRDEARVCISIK